MRQFSVRVPEEVLERFDSFASERGLTRSAAFRALIEREETPAAAPASRDDALAMLSESARGGSVAARIALARLLSAPVDPVQRLRDELAARRRDRGVAS